MKYLGRILSVINNSVDAVGNNKPNFAVINPVLSVKLCKEELDKVLESVERVASADLTLSMPVGVLMLSESKQ